MMGKIENCNRFRVEKWMWEVCGKFGVWVVLRWGRGKRGTSKPIFVCSYVDCIPKVSEPQ
jgi:hypothetical protein